jgi:hypothetical protein
MNHPNWRAAAWNISDNQKYIMEFQRKLQHLLKKEILNSIVQQNNIIIGRRNFQHGGTNRNLETQLFYQIEW